MSLYICVVTKEEELLTFAISDLCQMSVVGIFFVMIITTWDCGTQNINLESCLKVIYKIFIPLHTVEVSKTDFFIRRLSCTAVHKREKISLDFNILNGIT